MNRVHSYHRQITKKNFILIYLFSAFLYLGLNLSLLAANFQPQEFIEEHYYLPFHLIEFWAVFIFSVIEAFVLHSIGMLNFHGSWKDRGQVGLVWFNILFTMITAVLFSLYPEFYEVPAHYMEYSAQILLTIVNFVFVFGKSGSNQEEEEGEKQNPEDSITTKRLKKAPVVILANLSVFLSLLQLLVYSEAIPTAAGGERSGHFIEFVTESLNAVIVMWFTLKKFLIVSSNITHKYEAFQNEPTEPPPSP